MAQRQQRNQISGIHWRDRRPIIIGPSDSVRDGVYTIEDTILGLEFKCYICHPKSSDVWTLELPLLDDDDFSWPISTFDGRFRLKRSQSHDLPASCPGVIALSVPLQSCLRFHVDANDDLKCLAIGNNEPPFHVTAFKDAEALRHACKRRDIPVSDAAHTCAQEIVLKSVGSQVFRWAYYRWYICTQGIASKCTESPEKFRNDIDDIRRSLANICDTLSCDDCTKVHALILRKRRSESWASSRASSEEAARICGQAGDMTADELKARRAWRGKARESKKEDRAEQGNAT